MDIAFALTKSRNALSLPEIDLTTRITCELRHHTCINAGCKNNHKTDDARTHTGDVKPVVVESDFRIKPDQVQRYQKFLKPATTM